MKGWGTWDVRKEIREVREESEEKERFCTCNNSVLLEAKYNLKLGPFRSLALLNQPVGESEIRSRNLFDRNQG